MLLVLTANVDIWSSDQYLATKLSHYSTWLLNGFYIWKDSANVQV